MNKVADPTLYWAVLARPLGEVLTVEAESPGLHLGLLGLPPGLGASEAEGWLYDVIGVAHESSAGPPASQSIPALLHHALTGLLFSHGELWDRPGAPRPCSFAFAHTVHEVGFGWVGDAAISLWVDGKPREAACVAVRDQAGREARAWSISSDHSVQVRLLWRASPEAAAEVEAAWTAVARAEPIETKASAASVGEPTALDPRAAVGLPSSVEHEPSAEHATGSESIERPEANAEAESVAAMPRARGSVFSRWLRRGFSWLSAKRDRREEAPAAPVPSEEETPTATAEAHEEPPALAIAPEVIPPTPEPEAVTRSAVPATPPMMVEPILAPRVWRGVPERVPLTPEAGELTERTVGWGEPPDPHIIELPAPIERRPIAPAPKATVPAVPQPPKRGRAAPEPPMPEPAVTEPATIEPVVSEPVAMEPVVSEPVVSEPVVSERVVSEPVVPEPVVTEPAMTAPAVPEPVMIEPLPSPELAPTSTLRDTPRAEPVVAVAPPEPKPAVLPVLMRHSAKPPQRPAWPTMQQLARPEVPIWRRPWAWVVAVLVLFVGGWLVGAAQDGGRTRDATGRGALGGALHAIGLGGPRFVVNVTSRPPGAWIAVDGKTLALRTPATVEVTPGEHTIGLSFSDLGGANYTVRGLKGDRVALDATLWGVLEIFSPNEVGIIGVAIDGEMRGFAPLRVDSLTPGVHEVRFSGPGMASWGQTVDIHVGETKELLARATASPASGVLQVQGTLTDEQGTQPLKGAQVWIDGQLRGVTPLSLDLPRGPHSVRLVYKGQQAPIQVIDLPGGNQRFAVFELGMDREVPQLVAELPARLPRDRPTTVSASLAGAAPGEVREMWLHAQTADGPWRRYAMTLLKASGNVVGVTVFPVTAFDDQGRARYYLSAQFGQGEESFTEIRTAQLEKSDSR